MKTHKVPLTAAQCERVKNLVGMLHAGCLGWNTMGPSGEDMADGWREELRKLEAECVAKGGPKLLGIEPDTWAYLIGDAPYYLVPMPPPPCNPDGSMRL